MQNEAHDDDYDHNSIVEYRNGLEFYKHDISDKVWHVLISDGKRHLGEMLYSFDGKTYFNFFRDFHKLTEEQKKIFAEYNPTLAALKGY